MVFGKRSVYRMNLSGLLSVEEIDNEENFPGILANLTSSSLAVSSSACNLQSETSNLEA